MIHQCNTCITNCCTILHECYTDASPMLHKLHKLYINVTQMYSYFTTVTAILHKMLHQCDINVTQTVHQCYTNGPSMLHKRSINVTQTVHQCYTNDTNVTQILRQCNIHRLVQFQKKMSLCPTTSPTLTLIPFRRLRVKRD